MAIKALRNQLLLRAAMLPVLLLLLELLAERTLQDSVVAGKGVGRHAQVKVVRCLAEPLQKEGYMQDCVTDI
jgi:hypothetical protein